MTLLVLVNYNRDRNLCAEISIVYGTLIQRWPTYLQCPKTIISLSPVMARQQHPSEIFLGLLHLHDALFKGLADVEPDGCHLALLTDAMDASEGLFFNGRVPSIPVSILLTSRTS